ncbi:MAG: thermonuclease family protein [Patescibacteria group bacterium]
MSFSRKILCAVGGVAVLVVGLGIGLLTRSALAPAAPLYQGNEERGGQAPQSAATGQAAAVGDAVSSAKHENTPSSFIVDIAPTFGGCDCGNPECRSHEYPALMRRVKSGRPAGLMPCGAALVFTSPAAPATPSRGLDTSPLAPVVERSSLRGTTGGDGEKATVVRVVDGDTIEVMIEGKTDRVRYLGIDAPETVDPRKPAQCFGIEASKKNKELVAGKIVRLEKDSTERDTYNRLLRYLWLDDALINEALVAEGFARAATYPPDVKYEERFAWAERAAREEKRGLWSACPASLPYQSLQPALFSNS